MPGEEASLETLLLAYKDGLAIVTLNRPQAMNTINEVMARELLQTMGTLGSSEKVRAVLLRAAGQAFCAGADLGQQQQPGSRSLAFWVKDFVRNMNDVYLSILNMEKPVVCAVNGVAAGGGFALALACDMVIASDAARFSTVFARRGLGLEAGVSYLLPRTVGLLRAKELAFTADAIDAREAERIGLVNRAVAADRLDEEAMATATRLASGPTRALGLSKTMMHRGLGTDLATSMEWESWCQALCSETEDLAEGMTAFLEKRQPDFKGR